MTRISTSQNTAPSSKTDREKALEAAIAQIDKQFGKGSVMKLGDATQIKVETAKSQTYMNNAEASAVNSQSWAIGGTSTREGEDANNSKYYSDLSNQFKEIAEGKCEEAIRANMALSDAEIREMYNNREIEK